MTIPDGVEVFKGSEYCSACNGGPLDRENEPHLEHDKWYYWFCLPGCLPDSEPFGPYDTEDDAIADAREQCGGDE